ncbi:carboxylesterase/lipase family protein [Paeniglutamicibacter sp. R2-26]|uniref:carboxylesterase/lipase family protein n=1 Tax=Paeniglutamicibacter sp. R2-26 TaxID=3144417 RepID=UPI003EE5C0BF
MSLSDQQHVVPVIRRTLSGPVQGLLSGGIERFLGIPYAAAPVGDLRFALPVLPERWTEPRPALDPGPTAPQVPYEGALGRLLPTVTVPGDEYLNLNIFAPAHRSDTLRPVMVWFHGGSLSHGSNALPGYDGSAFARDAVVFVSVNYRLGTEGFSVLEGAPNNLGLADQVAALEWVKANISAFGGDPAQVTACGQSAGGNTLAALLAHPRANSLMSRAIIQSAPLNAQPLAKARRITQRIAADLGIQDSREDFLSKSPAELLASQARVLSGSSALSGGPQFAVGIEPELVPVDPLAALLSGEGSNVPLMIGTTTEEARLWLVPTGLGAKVNGIYLALARRKAGLPRAAQKVFRRNRPDATPGEILGALLTDKLLRVPMNKLADSRYHARAQTHVYEFAWRSPVEELGAAHAVELPFVFDNIALPDSVGLVGNAAPHALASAMHEAWVCFATLGDPGWPAWDFSRPVKSFDGKSNPVLFSPRDDECEALS